ncbi:MAG: FecR domain-containing protein [Rhodocyclales bacterium]|nr:FecR domain-containing protein [Rhodocyclales bacterium]
MPTLFRLKNPALLIALAAVYPLAAHAAGAAKVDFAHGSVTAVGAAGAARPLQRGGEIVSGEAVVTGDGGRAQLRFTDGGMVSLQPSSEFKVDDYRFSSAAGGEEKGFFSLLKGGLRAITGLVGKGNKSAYKVTTSVATIGIRGTEFTLAYSGADSVAVWTGEGAIEVCNNAGCTTVPAGASALVSGPNSEVKRSEAKPRMDPPPPTLSVLPVFSSTDVFAGDFVPTSPMPTMGSATYATIVSQASGSSQLNSASLSVNFGSLAFSTSLSGTVGAQTFSVSGSGSIAGNTLPETSLSGSGSFCSCTCGGSVAGTFYGAAAERVGLSYSVDNATVSPTATASGSALLTR